MSNELISITPQKQMQITDPASVASAETAKQKIQACLVIAKQFPRNTEQARTELLNACRRPSFARVAEYSKPVGGQSIKGPSIRFAESALRIWGNVSTDIQTIYEDEDIRRTKVTVMDLEKNTSFNKEINITKTVERKNKNGREVLEERKNTKNQTVYIVKATDDEMHNKEASAISKAIRNEGLRVIPADIIEEAIEICGETVRAGIKDNPAKEVNKVIDAFNTLNVQPVDLEAYLGHPIRTSSPAEVKELRNMYQAIKEGSACWQDYVDLKNGNQPATDQALENSFNNDSV